MQKETAWSAVQIPKQILEECEVFANSDMGRRLGFTKKSQVANAAIREYLSKFSITKEYFFNIQSDKLNTILSFKINDKKITCETCNSQKCEHVIAVYEDPKIKNMIKQRGIELDDSFYSEFFEHIDSLREIVEREYNEKVIKKIE